MDEAIKTRSTYTVSEEYNPQNDKQQQWLKAVQTHIQRYNKKK
jgi:hypothetical protein